MRILIVEDDVSFQRTLVNVIQRFMPDVVFSTCTSVPEATKLLTEFPTDVILLDIMLPGGYGIDVLKSFPNPEFNIICNWSGHHFTFLLILEQIFTVLAINIYFLCNSYCRFYKNRLTTEKLE